MLFLIIFGILIVIGVVLMFIGYKNRDSINFDTFDFGILDIAIGSLVLLICLMVGLIENSHAHIITVENNLSETVESLNTTYDNLILGDDRISIVEYNDKVKEFKSDVKSAREKMESPWIGIFICNAYENYTGDEVQYFKG